MAKLVNKRTETTTPLTAPTNVTTPSAPTNGGTKASNNASVRYWNWRKRKLGLGKMQPRTFRASLVGTRDRYLRLQEPKTDTTFTITNPKTTAKGKTPNAEPATVATSPSATKLSTTPIFLPHFPHYYTAPHEFFDEEAWYDYNYKVWERRQQIMDESITGSPLELFRRYPLYKDENAFVTYEQPTGKMLAQVDNCILYVNDAAELSAMAGCAIAADEWTSLIIDWENAEAKAEWQQQLEAFQRANYKVQNHPSFHEIARCRPIEVYDTSLRLLCVCPTRQAAVLETGAMRGSIWYACEHYTPTNNYYFRYFYDNNYKPVVRTTQWKVKKNILRRRAENQNNENQDKEQ